MYTCIIVGSTPFAIQITKSDHIQPDGFSEQLFKTTHEALYSGPETETCKSLDSCSHRRDVPVGVPFDLSNGVARVTEV